jgi:hypothetical protein
VLHEHRYLGIMCVTLGPTPRVFYPNYLSLFYCLACHSRRLRWPRAPRSAACTSRGQQPGRRPSQQEEALSRPSARLRPLSDMLPLLPSLMAALSGQGAAGGQCDAEPGRRASCYTQHWTSPPSHVPSGHSTDGPVIGNGDMGVVATGGAGYIQLYTGKNDFWSTRDVPHGGCAYALMGSGSLEISAASPTAPDTSTFPPTAAAPLLLPMNCSLFGCTCQGFADYFGAIAGTGWGCAPQPVRTAFLLQRSTVVAARFDWD